MDFQEELAQRTQQARDRNDTALEQGKQLYRDGIAALDDLAACAREAAATLTRHEVPASETVWHSRIKRATFWREARDDGFSEDRGWKLKGIDGVEMVLTLDGRLEQISRDSDTNRETRRDDYIGKRRQDLETWLGELEQGADPEMCIRFLQRAAEVEVFQKGGMVRVRDIILDDVASLLSRL